nr:hypothetical protein [Gemmatimonadaceae bacterium]
VAGLVAAGAILGSVATAGALLLVGTLTGALDGDVIVGAFVLAPVIGAPLGALLGPPAALLFLRRTPLLQLFTVPTVTAMIGGGATFASFSANPIAATPRPRDGWSRRVAASDRVRRVARIAHRLAPTRGRLTS